MNSEIFSAGGEKWHTGCFKCSMCNKMLDSTNNNAKDNVLYCKVGTEDCYMLTVS